MCPRIEYIYANTTDISTFINFGMTYYVNLSLIDTLVHAVMQTSMWANSEYPLISRCKDTSFF